MENYNVNYNLSSFFKTLIWFIGFCLSLPLFLVCYLVVSTTDTLWHSIVQAKYPNFELCQPHNLRSILDTSRNHGNIHILLHIEGVCNIEVVKETLFKYVLDRRNKAGKLCFPKLRQQVVSCWGMYAWIKNVSKFNINNHVILCPPIYRGRQVSEINIQEYISNIISKYMPTDIPQWQIFLIPTSDGAATTTSDHDTYYMLVRIHHLILSEETDLCLSNILLLDSFQSINIAFNDKPAQLHHDEAQYGTAEPFTNMLPSIDYLTKLYTQITVCAVNYWNEFIYHYEPTNDDKLSSSSASSQIATRTTSATSRLGITQFISVILISVVTVIADFCKGYHAIKSDPSIKFKFLSNLIKREVQKRNISTSLIVKCIFHSLHPMNILNSIVEIVWWLGTLCLFKIPYIIYKETMSCGRLMLFMDQIDGGYLVEYIPLVYNALKEIMKMLNILFTAPRCIYEEIFDVSQSEPNALQSVSLCGRKIVGWSEKFSIKDVKKICESHKITENELYFSVTSAAMMSFLDEFKCEIPSKLGICSQYIRQNYLLGKKNYTDGYLFINLPLKAPSSNQIRKIRKSLQRSRDNQVALYFMYLIQKRYQIITKILPTVWTKLLFNYLTKKFTITITKIEENNYRQLATTLWGHKIVDALYFTPPQSNLSVALTLQSFGEHIRLSVMTDSQISPSHTKISSSWLHYMKSF